MTLDSNIKILVEKAKTAFLASRDANDGEIGNGWYDLGKYLAAMHLKCRGAEDFEKHCETIGIAPRTGYYIVATYRVFFRLRIKPPDGISWRKLGELVPVLRWENREKLFRLCREYPREEIVEIVKNWRR